MSNKLTVRAIMEILGTPKDHVDNTAKQLLDKIKERKEIELLKSYISESKETKVSEEQRNVKFFSNFIEVDISLNNMEELVGFCFDFMPGSIDILEPSNLQIDAKHLNNVINDLMARLHRYDMYLKNLKAQSNMMQKELEKKKN